MKIKYSYITPFFPYKDIGGVSDYSYLFIKELKKRQNFEINIFTRKAGRIRNVENTSINRIISNNLLSFIRLITNKEIIKSNIVQLELPCQNKFILYYLLFCYMLKFISNSKLIIRLHEYSERPLIKKIFLILFVMASYRTICATREDELMISRLLLNKNKVLTIPIFSNIKNFNIKEKEIIQLRNKMRSNFIIGYFGQIISKHDQKGGWFLLKVIKNLILKYKFNDFIFCKIGGSDDSKKIFYKILKKHKRNLHFTGYVSERDVSKYIYACDVMVFPFLNGFRNNRASLIASIMHDKCIITTKDKKEVYPANIDNCICFVERDVDKFCKKIIYFSNNIKEIKKYEESVKNLKYFYSIRNIVNQFNKLYETL